MRPYLTISTNDEQNAALVIFHKITDERINGKSSF